MKFLYLIFFLYHTCMVTSYNNNNLEINNTWAITEKNFTLTRYSVPYEYDLTITLEENFLDTAVYQGVLLVKCDILKLRNGYVQWSMYLWNVKVENVELLDDENKIDVKEVEWFVDYRLDILVAKVKYEEKLARGTKMSFLAHFTGIVSEELGGFQTISDTPGKKEPKWIVAARWAPWHARTLFPAFDEPDVHAVFKITLIHPNEYTVLSNTGVNTTENHPENTNLKITSLNETPKMAHHLLAIVLVKDQKTITIPVDGVFHLLHYNGDESDYEYFKSNLDKLFERMKKITDVNLSIKLKKIDHVVISGYVEDVVVGYGLIIYREAALRLPVEDQPALAEQKVLALTAFAAAYTYFGVLRVPNSWNRDSWVTEGVSKFFEYYAINEEPDYKDWRMMDQFVVRELQPMLKFEGLKSTIALSSEVDNIPLHLRDSVTSIRNYRKGASVVRTIWVMLNDTLFKQGIRQYMSSKHLAHFKCVTTSIFFDSWNEKDLIEFLPKGKSLKDVMTPWVTEAGCPLGLISSDGGSLSYTIQKYFPAGHCDNENCLYSPYYIPVVYTTSESPTVAQVTGKWLTPEKTKDTLDGLDAKTFVMPNHRYMNYMRLRYPMEQYNLLKEDYTKMDVLGRAQIIDDLMESHLFEFWPDHSKFIDLLTVMLDKEEDYIPWYTALENFGFLRNKYIALPWFHRPLDRYIQKRIQRIYDTLKKDMQEKKNFTHIELLKGSLIKEWYCKITYDCRKEAREKYYNFKKGGKRDALDSNFRKHIYRELALAPDEWTELFKQVLTNNIGPANIEDIIYGLACRGELNETDIDFRMMENVIDPNSTLRNDYTEVILKSYWEYGWARNSLNFTTTHFNELYKPWGLWKQLQNVITYYGCNLRKQERPVFKEFSALLTDSKYNLTKTWQSAKEVLERATVLDGFDIMAFENEVKNKNSLKPPVPDTKPRRRSVGTSCSIDYLYLHVIFILTLICLF